MITIITVIFLVTAISFALNRESGFSKTDGEANTQLAIEIAENINDSGLIFEKDKVIGYVDDLPIYRSEVELKKIWYDGMNKSKSPDDYRTAFNKVLIEKQEDLILEEFGIPVTKEEIKGYNDEQKEMLYSSTDFPEDDKKRVESHNKYISAIGLTEEEYWEVLRPIEAKRQLSLFRVQELLHSELNKGNNEIIVNNKSIGFKMAENEQEIIIDVNSIEYTIIDDHYSNLLEGN